MSAVYITLWLAGAVGIAHLIEKAREMARTDDAIHEWLDATTQLSDEDNAR